MEKSRTKEEIFKAMREEMPWKVIGEENLKPYILEAMQIYADQEVRAFGMELTFEDVFPEFGGAVFLCYVGKLPHKYFDYIGCYRGSKNDWENKEKTTIRIANTPIGSKTSIGFGHGHSTEFSKIDFCLSPSDKNYKGRDWKRRKLNGEPSRIVLFFKCFGKMFKFCKLVKK